MLHNDLYIWTFYSAFAFYDSNKQHPAQRVQNFKPATDLNWRCKLRSFCIVDCVYNGALFKEGESWADGCDLTCTCEDAEKGYYRCNDRCVQVLIHYSVLLIKLSLLRSIFAMRWTFLKSVWFLLIKFFIQVLLYSSKNLTFGVSIYWCITFCLDAQDMIICQQIAQWRQILKTLAAKDHSAIQPVLQHHPLLHFPRPFPHLHLSPQQHPQGYLYFQARLSYPHISTLRQLLVWHMLLTSTPPRVLV